VARAGCFHDTPFASSSSVRSTLRNITGAWVKDQAVEVEGGQITAYQVVLEVTFVLD
jgi:flavin-binding protein dodecin